MAPESFKAVSVTEAGEPDGFVPPLLFAGEIAPDGTTRLLVSAGPDRLQEVHRAIVSGLESPLGILWVQLVDRVSGEEHQADPRRWLSMEIDKERLVEALTDCAGLLYRDGRGQLWIRDAYGQQVVLDELGLVYAYPDDPSVRSVLAELGIPEESSPTMADRDYVRVEYRADADEEEKTLLTTLGMQHYAG